MRNDEAGEDVVNTYDEISNRKLILGFMGA